MRHYSKALIGADQSETYGFDVVYKDGYVQHVSGPYDYVWRAYDRYLDRLARGDDGITWVDTPRKE